MDVCDGEERIGVSQMEIVMEKTTTKQSFKLVLLRNLAGVLAIVWMCVIFAFSAQTKEESGEVSQSFTYQMVSSTRFFFHLDMDDARVKEIADAIEGFVRKSAHMTEYGILSMLLYIWIGQWPMSFLRRWGTAFGAATVYATTDEIHQLFVAGRSGRFTDVCIDGAGAALGIIVFVLLVRAVKLVRAAKVRRQEREELREENRQEKEARKLEKEERKQEKMQQEGQRETAEPRKEE